MNKLIYFSLSITVISVGLLSMQQHEGQPGQEPASMVELVSSDAQAFSLPKAAAKLSPTLQTFLSAELPEQPEQQIPLSIDSKSLVVVVKVLIALHEKIIEQKLRPFPKSETIKHSIGDGYVTQNLQKLVNPIIYGANAKDVIAAFDFLLMPALTNAACRLFVLVFLEKHQAYTLSEFMGTATQFIPQHLLAYAEKHYLMHAANVGAELSISDYITLKGMPAIGMVNGSTMEVDNYLKEIDLSDRALTNLDGIEQLPELSTLQILRLTKNQLTLLAPETFQGLTNLIALWLSKNKLSSLAPGTFQRLTSLRHLGLDNNQFTSLAPGTFQGLISLRYLGLDHNQLTSLEPGTFQGLTNLQNLWLSFNRLSSLEPGTFQELTNLQHLKLYYNAVLGTEKYFRQRHALSDTVQIQWEPQYSLGYLLKHF